MNQPIDEQRKLAERILEAYYNPESSEENCLNDAHLLLLDAIDASYRNLPIDNLIEAAVLLGVQFTSNLAAELFTSTFEEPANSSNEEELALMQKIVQNYRLSRVPQSELDKLNTLADDCTESGIR